MFLILLVIFGILSELVCIVGGVYFIKKYMPQPKSNLMKVNPVVKPIEYVKIKRSVRTLHDSIYTQSTSESPVKRSGGNLVPYGLTDEEKFALEMFFDRD